MMTQTSPAEPVLRPAPDRPKPRGKRGGKRIGIREIAKLADVSVATVSMVLNNSPKITEATRRRVRTVMDQTGYHPNRAAQSLSGKYTRMLAVLMPTLRHGMADPYFGELISGICDRAARLGHKVMLEHAKPDFIKEKKHLELFERKFVDGVFCVGFNDRHTFLTDFPDLSFPMVVVNSIFPQWGLDHVVCDYASGADQVMTYLLQLGHRRIGMVHGSNDVATARQLMEAYQKRVAEAGLGLDDSWLIDGRFTEQHGYEAAEELFNRHPDTTAVFAGNDKMALGVMHYLAHKNIRIPQDVSVIGFDDIQYSAFVNPTLSTVHLPLYEVGMTACERLIEKIRGKRSGIHETMTSHLILRESTSLAPRTN